MRAEQGDRWDFDGHGETAGLANRARFSAVDRLKGCAGFVARRCGAAAGVAVSVAGGSVVRKQGHWQGGAAPGVQAGQPEARVPVSGAGGDR